MIGSLPATAIMPVSSCCACGRYCLRTREPAPSAPTSRSPVAVEPSAKYAVTVPSPCCSKPVNSLPNVITSSKPVMSTWRRVIRLTDFSLSTGSSSRGISSASTSLSCSVSMLN